MKWFWESNRYKHFFYAIPVGFLLTTIFGAGVATGMEFKDKKQGNSWDWIDWGCTVVGSLVGDLLRTLCIFAIF